MKRVKELTHYWCEDIKEHHYLGKGVTVAVLDTGIAPHPDFRGKVVVFQDFVNGQDMVYDDNGHGTHVCGVIGGSGSVSKGVYAGMAPSCDLAVIKVLDQAGNGRVEQVVSAIRWILKNRERYQIRVVNISVGMEAKSNSQEEVWLMNYVEALWDAGLVVVVAAGNRGPKEGSVTTPGVSKKVITVGSVEEWMNGTHSRRGVSRQYSGRGPTSECVCKPDLVAPGSQIVSCNGAFVTQKKKAYVAKSGTSMSTPIVAGAITNLLSKYPDMTNVEVKLRLRDSCTDLGLSRNHQGWGMLHVEALLKK